MSFPVVGSPAMVLDPNLSLADALVLQNLFGGDISAGKVLTTSQEKSRIDSVVNSRRVSEDEAESDDDDVVKLIETNGLNSPLDLYNISLISCVRQEGGCKYCIERCYYYEGAGRP